MSRPTLIAFEELPEEVVQQKFIITLSNPRFWKQDGVRNRFDLVYAPSYPEIEEAYQKGGKEVYRSPNSASVAHENEPESVSNPDPVPTPTPETEAVTEPQKPTEKPVEDEGKDWREMKWLELRTFAKNFTDEVIRDKEHAKEVCQKAEDDGLI